MASDRFIFTILSPDDWALYKFTANKNLAFYPTVRAVFPVGGKIQVYAQTPIFAITLMLKPCSIITATAPPVAQAA
jgi:hypothetical protein